MTLLTALAFVGAYILCRAWASLMVRLADSGCQCAKGKVCAKCLAESEAIRPQPGRVA